MSDQILILITDFIQHLKLERGLSENSLSAYESDLKEFVKYSEVKDPKELAPRKIADYFGKLSKLGRKPATLARKISALKHFFEFLKEQNLIPENPAKAYSAPKIVRYHPDYLSPTEIEKIINVTSTDDRQGRRNRAMLELLYGSGLRVSELLNMRLPNVEFEAGFVRVTGKGSKQRLVPLGGYAKNALESYIEASQKERALQKTTLVFPSRGGKPFSRAGIWKIIRNLVIKAGISKKVTPHTFRHSFATHMIEGGADLRTLQEMLGHADISTTEIYTKIDRDYIVAEHRKHHPRERKKRD